MSNAKERPILFSASMVRAILEGRKTETRRALNPQPVGGIKFNPCAIHGVLNGEGNPLACKFGRRGDRLWVRETWQHSNHPLGPLVTGCNIFYRADYWNDPHGMDGEKSEEGKYRTWKPSVHMPRWASRINLEIINIRVERLQDISEADAMAEGARKFDDLPSIHPYGQDSRWSMEAPSSTDECLGSAKMAFANFFEKINGDGAWGKNPWCWVVEFRRV